MYDAAVQNIGSFVESLTEIPVLADGNSMIFKMDDNNHDFVVRHEGVNAIVYRCNRSDLINTNENHQYAVPWEVFVKTVETITIDYMSIINDCKNYISRFHDEPAYSVSSNGLQLHVSIDKRFLVIGSSITVRAELKNISDKTIELLNFIQPNHSSSSIVQFYLSGRDFNSIKQDPLILKPDESYSASEKIEINHFASLVAVDYRGLKDIRTTMFLPAFFFGRGLNKDLLNCWSGELEIKIPILTLAENWKEKIYPETDVGEWLRKMTEVKGCLC